MKSKKVLFVHNFYQVPGGEDAVFSNEADLLRGKGHDVIDYVVTNDDVLSNWSKLKVALGVVFSVKYYFKFKSFLKRELPDVVHVHNYFPLLSPAIFFACKSVGIPVVHTLHNYRAVCPTALLMYGGRINERSVKKSSFWALKEKVYKDSFFGTLALISMIEAHKKSGTWRSKVDCFISLTEFSREKFIEAGWPSEKIYVKPNFMSDPYDGMPDIDKRGGYALFLGRISEEKGVELLLEAWEGVNFKLKVVGDGPLLETLSNSRRNVEFLGRKNKEEVQILMQHAEFVIMPSTWYEGFPMVLIEAFANGTPALVSRIGSMQEIVDDFGTGRHFIAGDIVDLREKIYWFLDNLDEARKMGHTARVTYLEKYTPGNNYKTLMNIYEQVIENGN